MSISEGKYAVSKWNTGLKSCTFVCSLCSDQVLSCTTDKSCSNSQQGQQVYVFSKVARPALGPTQHLTQWVAGDLSPGIKWPGGEADPHL